MKNFLAAYLRSEILHSSFFILHLKAVSLRPIFRKRYCRSQLRNESVVCVTLVWGGDECGFRLVLPLFSCYCDAGRSDESKETVLRSEKDGYTAVGRDGVVVLFLFVVPVREL